MRKIDIMNSRDIVEPGEVSKWQLVDGKVTKTEDVIVPEKEEEIKVVGPVVKEAIKEITIVPKKKLKEKTKWTK